MPFEIEKDGEKLTVWTEEEVQQEVKGLKVTNENLKAEKKEINDKLTEAKENARQLEEAKAKAEGDNETLQRLADERESEKRQAVEDERKKFADLVNMTKKEKVENYLNSLVEELKPADTVKAKHLKQLLKGAYEFDVDLEKGEFSVKGDKVTNAEELKKHVTESEEYRYLLAGSGANGGGSHGGNASGAGKKFAECSGEELAAIKRENPAEYDRMKQEHLNTQ